MKRKPQPSKRKPVRHIVLLVAEFQATVDDLDCQRRLDNFREAAHPAMNYGITLYRATPADAARFFATYGDANDFIPALPEPK